MTADTAPDAAPDAVPDVAPDVAFGKPRFALFLNGANFACEVLQSLQHQGFEPALLVLPEYSPAATPASTNLIQRQSKPQHRLSQLAGNIEIAYAPPALQAQCACLLQQRAIEFMLVACWPYLIDQQIVNSVTRAALNLHPSLLPRYRGADPIGEQLKSDEVRFGVSLHLLNSRFDQGDIVAQAELPAPAEHKQRAGLEQACAQLGSRLFIDALNGYDAGWRTIPQKPRG
jgi:methionyl-tRNA formyltransferase